jgi:hypothetical protein
MPTNKDFADMANPHSWFLVADNLHAQAVSLFEGRTGGSLDLRATDGRIMASWPSENRAVFLLAGFALENALKAFIVYQNPNMVANGRLGRGLQSHKLTILARRVERVPWPKLGYPVLREFERGIDSWARYPCALSASESESEQVLPNPLWRRYRRLIRAYGQRLRRLLRRGWSGPHGAGGVWKVTGDFLGA